MKQGNYLTSKELIGEERNILKTPTGKEGFIYQVTLLTSNEITYFTNIEDVKAYCFMTEPQIPSLRDIYFDSEKHKYVAC